MDDTSLARPSTAAAPVLTLARQTQMVRALAAVLRGSDGRAVELVETHISFVLVHGERAYKFKKALRNAFLDQSTLALRRQACTEELRLNRRLAPEMYLDVAHVTGSPEHPALEGPGLVLDVAVVMRAFDQAGLWDRLAGRGALGNTDIDELAARLAAFHESAAVARRDGAHGTPAHVCQPLLDSLRDLQAQWPDAEGRSGLAGLRAWEAAARARLAPLMQRRLARGRVRECHGDLHLGNVARVDGHTTVFDGIEFNDDFRWLDVIDEIAFMAMDLHAHGLPALAHRFVDAYLQHSGDYDGVRLLGYYTVHRALVRAKVALLRAAQASAGSPLAGHETAEARQYLDLALSACRTPPGDAGPATLMLTHGCSGSGKSTLTQGLLEASGAIRIRADVERKRLAAVGVLENSGSALHAGLYGPAMTEATYARLLEAAVAVVEGGRHAILDATYLRRRHRAEARRWAAAHGVRCFILDFVADEQTLLERVRTRSALGADASDADERVVQAQLASAEPLLPAEQDAVFRVQPLPRLPGAPPQADWRALLAALDRPATPP